jgi:aminoglycoside 2''-phosphotransferase
MELEEKRPLYRQQIKQVEPALNIKSWQENQEGLVNDVIIINGERIFRFPKNDSWAVEHLWAEANCLTLLRQHLDMPLPHWTIYEGALIDTPFISYKMIAGKALQWFEIAQLSEKEQDRLAEQIATFLRQMHTIPMQQVVEAEIKPSVTNRTQERWLKLYEDVQRELFPHLMAFQKEWVHYHFAPLVSNPTRMDCQHTMMNGDLGSYHLLYNPESKRLNGVIDFGTAGIGDPACDIACLLDQFGIPFIERISKFYDVTAYLERARFWAGTMWLQWALGGLRYPDEPSWFFVHIGRARPIS